jgi:hypothetical protein
MLADEATLIRRLAREAVRREWRSKGLRRIGEHHTLHIEAQAYLHLHRSELVEEARIILSEDKQ